MNVKLEVKNDRILALEGVTVTLGDEAKHVLVDNVDLSVFRGECLGLVGESGSGKSLLLRSIVGLIPPPLNFEGTVRYSSAEGSPLKEINPRAARGRDVSMIFQEPMRSLNPVRRIEWTLAEPLRMHLGLKGDELESRILSALADVGIHDPERVARCYPHQLSGGLQQRVMIAAALSTDPALLLCDEPTTALDVTTQATILELLRGLQERKGLSLVFVSHDLAVISEIADRVAVLYRSQLLEVGSAQDVINQPAHSYTQKLVNSVPERALAQRSERKTTERGTER